MRGGMLACTWRVNAPAVQQRKIWIKKRQNENSFYPSQCFHRQHHGGISWVVGLQRRTVIETRAEQCEKVTAQKDCRNSNINAIKCVCAGVCRSNLYRLIVTQHGELHMWGGGDDNGSVFETQGCCQSLFFHSDKNRVCLLWGLFWMLRTVALSFHEEMIQRSPGDSPGDSTP